ncbi:hypothetical protein DL96DRAFT_1610307 [Flagelloscypha sp. PMI_526]|nr:hypothetical protein DL96DRAFT_1610307 [Flagelloscypha sp. PMI_526]
MFLPRVFLGFLLPSCVWSVTQYYIDDSNTTAWTFNTGTDSYFNTWNEPQAYGGTYHDSGGSGVATGSLTFRGNLFFKAKITDDTTMPFTGSSVDIYGIARNNEGLNCRIDYKWSSGSATYSYPEKDWGYNILFVRAEGFDPGAVSTISFSEQELGCYGGPDYAVVTVEDTNSTSSAASSTTSVTYTSFNVQHSIGAIVGGVLGGVVGILAVLLVGIWIIARRRKLRQSRRAPTPTSDDSKAGFDQIPSPGPSNTSIPPQGVPGFNNVSRVSNTPPWPQPQI